MIELSSFPLTLYHPPQLDGKKKEFPMSYPDRDDVIVPQYAIQVGVARRGGGARWGKFLCVCVKTCVCWGRRRMLFLLHSTQAPVQRDGKGAWGVVSCLLSSPNSRALWGHYGADKGRSRGAPVGTAQMLGVETKGEAIITTGVGQHQMWAAQWYPYNEPRRWVTSGGLGSMGFGLPSALGVATAYDGKNGRPKRTVVDIDGDGSFLMNVQVGQHKGRSGRAHGAHGRGHLGGSAPCVCVCVSTRIAGGAHGAHGRRACQARVGHTGGAYGQGA